MVLLKGARVIALMLTATATSLKAAVTLIVLGEGIATTPTH